MRVTPHTLIELGDKFKVEAQTLRKQLPSLCAIIRFFGCLLESRHAGGPQKRSLPILLLQP